MELNARMICILQEVVEAQGAVTVEQICSRNDISKRTFYYDIKNVNAWLREKELPEILLKSGTCTIDHSVGEALGDVIRGSDTEYFMSVDERKIMMVLYIGLAEERIRIQTFCDLFDISKNTVLSDMKSIRTELGQRNVELKFDAELGYFFRGNESAIRNYLYSQFKKVRSLKTSQYIRRFLNEQLATMGREEDYWEALRECLVIYEEVAHTSIVENDTDGSVFILALAHLRHGHGHPFRFTVTETERIRETRAYQGAEILFRKIAEYVDLHAGEEEIYYVALCFLAMQNFDPVATEEQDPEMVRFTDRFLAAMEQSGKVEFKEREMLVGRLVNHITPMLYRINYGVQLDNPIADTVKKDYAAAFALARKGLLATDAKIAKKITEDELAYLAIYIADGIKSGTHISNAAPGKILVVCAEGVATALLIRDQLAELLHVHYEYDLASVKNIAAVPAEEYLLMVTAVKCDLPPEKTVRVNLFLTEDNKRSILEILNGETIHARLKPRELMSIVRRYVGDRPQQLAEINLELLNYINAHRA